MRSLLNFGPEGAFEGARVVEADRGAEGMFLSPEVVLAACNLARRASASALPL